METGLDVLVGFDGYCTSECRPALCVLDVYQLREEYTEDYRDILKTTRDILKITRDIHVPRAVHVFRYNNIPAHELKI